MFFKDKKEYWEVCPKWTVEKVEKLAKEYKITLGSDCFENRWAIFGRVLGQYHGLNDIAATSMGYVVSSFFADMGVHAGTDVYFKEENIDFAVLDELNRLREEGNLSELEVMRELLAFILDLYANHIDEYEYHNVRFEFRVSQSELDRLKNVPGRTRADKFRFLLSFWEEGGN